MLPRRITKILRKLDKQDTRPPMCNDFCGTKATRRPWRTSAGKGNASHIKPATSPGDVVSVDQLESSIPGFIGQITGKLTRQRIVGSTVYVDHQILVLYFIKPQCHQKRLSKVNKPLRSLQPHME